VNVIEREVEDQVQFWSLLGPFLILSSIAVLLFKLSSHWYFPLSALVGIPLCLKWKMKGMTVALSLLLGISTFAYQSLSLDERYWHVGMALTIAFSFIILTLSFEEVESLIEKMKLESKSRLENFLHLDEKWKEAEKAWLIERENLFLELRSLTNEKAKINEDKQSYIKLSQLTNEELCRIKEQHDLMIQEIFFKKQYIGQQQERIEEMELTIQKLVCSESEKSGQLMSECTIENDRLSSQLAILQAENQQFLQAINDSTSQINELNQLHQSATKEIEEYKKQLDHLTVQLAAEIEKGTKKLEDNESSRKEEKEPFEAMYKQLKEQFREKAAHLDAARRELFYANEKILAFEMSRQAVQLEDQFNHDHAYDLFLAQLEIEELKQAYQTEIEQLTDLIAELFRK
jgi:hypothetical protein